MRIIITCLALIAISPVYAQSNCGDLPNQPELLSENQVTVAEFEILESQMENYFSVTEAYQSCLQGAMPIFDPEGDDVEQFQSVIDEITRLDDALEEQKLMSINRFNDLLTSERKLVTQ